MADIGNLIASIGADISDLKRSVKSAEKELKGYSNSTDKELTKVDKRWTLSSKNIKSGIIKFAGAAGLGLGILELGRFAKASVIAGVELDSLNRSLVAITGSTSAASAEFNFVNKTAKDLGLNLNSLESSYKDILAASKGTTLEGENIQKVFTSISKASAVLGLSADDTKGALRALSQMISKGNVQAEELRGQLGERLPGAFQLASEAMGVSTQELNKMLEQGQVLASDLLPKLADVLENKYGKAAESAGKSSRAAFENLNTAILELQRSIAQSGLTQFFADLARGATVLINLLNTTSDSTERLTGEMGKLTAQKNILEGLGKGWESAAEASGQYKGVVDSLARSDSMAEWNKAGMERLKAEQKRAKEQNRITKKIIAQAGKDRKAEIEFYEDKAETAKKAHEQIFTDLKKINTLIGISDSTLLKMYKGQQDKREKIAKKTYEEQAKFAKETHTEIFSDMKKMNTLIGNEDLVALEGFKNYQREKILASDNFFAGFKMQMEDSQKDMKTWADQGVKISKDLAQNSRNALSDGLFSVLKGDLDDISQIWDSFMDSMLRSLTDTVAQMAIQWGIGAVGGVTGWWDGGAWEIKRDHVAMVHKGEMIVPADVASVVRGGKGSSNVSDLAKISPNGGHEWSSTATSALVDSGNVHDGLNAMLQGSKGPMIGHAAQGLSLLAGGNISFGEFAKGVLSPQALVGSVIFGGLPNAINEQMGMNSSNWGKGGSTLLGLLLGKAFGPIGNLAGSVIGGSLGMMMGDAFDARSNEQVRDMIEANMQATNGLLGGWVAAQSAYGGLQGSMGQRAGDLASTLGIGNVGAIAGSFGSGNTGVGAGTTGSGGYDTGGGYGGGFAGGGYGMKEGGAVDRLMVPGEDGLAALRFGEGVVNQQGMETLAKINEGEFGAGITIGSLITVQGDLIADEDTFNDFVEKIDDRLTVLNRYGR